MTSLQPPLDFAANAEVQFTPGTKILQELRKFALNMKIELAPKSRKSRFGTPILQDTNPDRFHKILYVNKIKLVSSCLIASDRQVSGFVLWCQKKKFSEVDSGL
jgi:hypothetical protein